MNRRLRLKKCFLFTLLMLCLNLLCIVSYSQGGGGYPGGGGGGYPGGGGGGQTFSNFHMEVTAQGTITGDANFSPDDYISYLYASVNNHYFPMTSWDGKTFHGQDALANYLPLPVTTDIGGFSIPMTFLEWVSLNGNGRTGDMSVIIDGKLHVKLTWRPKNGDFQYDPPPEKLKIIKLFRWGIQATAKASAGYATASSILKSNPISNSISAVAPADSNWWKTGDDINDPYTFDCPLTPASGIGVYEFDIPIYHQSFHHLSSPNFDQVESRASAELDLTIIVGKFQISRKDNMSGNNPNSSADPSFTRWLPMEFSPTVNSQPYRVVPGSALPKPWGNVDCMYSMRLESEGGFLDPLSQLQPINPNYDTNGVPNLYYPNNLAPYAGAATPYTRLKGNYNPSYAITDSNGQRLLFDNNRSPYPDVHSVFQSDHRLSAGPPGSLNKRGNYLYAFGIPADNWYRTLFISEIRDEFGNIQSMAPDAFFPSQYVVHDYTSGRKLVFHIDPITGYFNWMDAFGSLGEAAGRTLLSFDNTGHLLSLKRCDPTGSIVYQSDEYVYGGENSDAVVAHTQNGISTLFNYIADYTIPDPFGTNNGRLSTVTTGFNSDTRSSYDGGPITGTYSYIWGPTQLGYNNWGIDARTNYYVDALGNQTSQVFTLQNGSFGDINQIKTYAPPFAGDNNPMAGTLVKYIPTVVNPSMISTFFPYHNDGDQGYQWDSMFDSGNLTKSRDPMGHEWNYNYTQNGTLLDSIVDPT